ncbi:MarR family winged helix-turn-helix transcriptional regulator [Brevibacillus dissolubilis]|uniref:MarR family winged helix-turn-helix transcriptional regulator n=1 Tax=Brevibacillus dissolubilis TaxID=1844116 RepID=UPI001116D70E|nr:MarR family transcriptional regulator [Brevibacillus dissolubilis]
MDGIAQLPLLLNQTSKLYLGILTEELGRCGITKPQILVVEQLMEGRKTIGEISKAVDLSYSTVSGIIDRLERDNLVMRSKDEKDRRIVWVSLTEEPEWLKKNVPFMQEEYFPGVFAGISEEKVQQIAESLEVLNTFLEQKYKTLCRERGK